MGCTRIRPSSPSEKLVFDSDMLPNEVVDADDSGTGVISAPHVEFSPVCPLDARYLTVVIQNFGYAVDYMYRHCCVVHA